MDVTTTHYRPSAVLVTGAYDNAVRVRTTWVATNDAVQLDRPSTYTLSFGADTPAHRALAARYVRAVEAGAVWYDVHLAVDANDETYVAATSHVLGRTANADLRRLGF